MFKNFSNRLKNEFKGYNLSYFSKDVMSGLTVTAVALPLALAFGVSCGASAASGLVTAIIAGLIIGALSGASYQISGPTGAMSAILIGIVAKDGLQNVFYVSLFAGIIILLCGILKLGKLVKMIPRPVIAGFTSGIAVIIALGQIDNFFGTHSVGTSAIDKLLSYGRLGFKPNLYAVLLGAIVVVIMIIWPKKFSQVVPGSLVGIIVSTVVCIIFKFDVATVGEIPKTLFLSERLDLTMFDVSKISSYLSPAVSIAALGIIESLLCGASASRMKNESFDANQELLAQGLGNILLPFFGGVPATAAIARTSVAIKSGCRTRICGIIHALGLLASMFLLGPVMAKLPLSALAGVLMVTAWRMNEWSSIKEFFGKKYTGACVKFLVTMVSTVIFDLTVAIVIGIVVSAIMYIANSSKISLTAEKRENGIYDIKISGSLFFLNAGKFEEYMTQLPDDVNEVHFNFDNVPMIDATGLEVIKESLDVLHEKRIATYIYGVNEDVSKLLLKGIEKEIIQSFT